VTLERALHPVVFVIGDRGVARINDLATDLGLEASTVSRHVSKLVERGLALRAVDASDRRAIAVRLSKKGALVRERLTEAWESMLADAMTVSGIDHERFGADFVSVADGMASFVEPTSSAITPASSDQPAGGRRAPLRAR
jgi:DNA-binding MarR family transcriptional regulator